MMKKILPGASLFWGLLFFAVSSHASERYFLCGPDEDGCYGEISQYCACIPYDEVEANQQFCLDFDKLTCTPLSKTPNCKPGFIFQNQGSCLATIFQSEPYPPCPTTTRTFCLEHHTPICDKNGQPNSCH